jgi:NAD-dependent dihydropyrimidine dehydrogenase PreA subunit
MRTNQIMFENLNKNLLKGKNFVSTDSIIINPHKCKGCWKCADGCPKQIFFKIDKFFGLHKHIMIVNPSDCIGCKKCVKCCSHGAIIGR